MPNLDILTETSEKPKMDTINNGPTSAFAFREFANQMETGAKKKESSRGPPPGLENPIPSWMNKNYENPFSKFKPEDLFKPNDSNKDKIPSFYQFQEMMKQNMAKNSFPNMPMNPMSFFQNTNTSAMMNNAMMMQMMSMAPMWFMMFNQQLQQNMAAQDSASGSAFQKNKNALSVIEQMMKNNGGVYGNAEGNAKAGSLTDNNFSTPNSDSPNTSHSFSPKNNYYRGNQEFDATTFNPDVTQKLVMKHNLKIDVNPNYLTLPRRGKYFIIKSFTEEDVHRAVKYKYWCSTYYGNRRLEAAWDLQESDPKTRGEVYLFFSVNSSGHFCGIAKMESRPSNENVLDIWTKDEHNEGGENSKWRGGFRIKWLYIKDIPNQEFSHLKVVKNGSKPFPHSRDTQEVDRQTGDLAMRIFYNFSHKTSLLDDYEHYDKLEERQRCNDRANSYKKNNNNNSNRKGGKKFNKKFNAKNAVYEVKPKNENNNEFPGVMDNMKKSAVASLRADNKVTEKNSKEKVSRVRKPGQPGPNALKIVKPDDTEQKSEQVDSKN